MYEFQKLNINPNDYMLLIYNLTADWSRWQDSDRKIRSVRHTQFISCEQVLTEHGLCYQSNNVLSDNLSAS